MDRKLLWQAAAKFLSGMVACGLVLFLPAGTFRYWNAWLFMGLLFFPMLIAGAVLLVKSPELLRKRLDTRETEPAQKNVVLLSSVMFLASFVVAGLNFRFSWIVLPRWLIVAASAVLFLSYLLYGEVLRENAYLSRTVKVQEHQRVVDTGLYGIVRHPMYTSTILLFLSMPLVLGSPISLLILLPYPLLIAKRIRNEEQVLEQGLEGYAAYKKRVTYRLFPFLW